MTAQNRPGLRLGYCPDKLIHYLAVPENFDVWDAANSELFSQFGIGLRIDLRQKKVPAELACQLLQERAQDSTRPAPGHPEVDNDRPFERFLEDCSLKIGLVHILHMNGCSHRCSSIG